MTLRESQWLTLKKQKHSISVPGLYYGLGRKMNDVFLLGNVDLISPSGTKDS